MTDTGKRIEKVIRHLGLNKNSFSRAIGMTNNVTIGRILNEDRNPHPSTLKKIVDHFPQINYEWLTEGKGDMINIENTQTELSDKESYRLVPMYNMDARGGFGANDQIDVAEYVIDYIPFKDAKQDDICVPIIGNSMAPTYCSGSTVLLHQVERWEEFLELGQVYMIVLKDGRRLIMSEQILSLPQPPWW